MAPSKAVVERRAAARSHASPKASRCPPGTKTIITPASPATCSCPVDAAYRNACECKASEVLVVEPDGYLWTTERDHCRGCDYERQSGRPCPIHKGRSGAPNPPG